MSLLGTRKEYLDCMEKGVTDFTKDGKCSNCGACCADMLPLTKEDIKRISKYVSSHHLKEHIHCPPTNTPIIDSTCPFRNDMDKKCEIYHIRPIVCHAFICSEPNWRLSIFNGKPIEIRSMRQTFFPKQAKRKVMK